MPSVSVMKAWPPSPFDKCHIRVRHARRGVEALRSLDHGTLHGLILVAGEEIDLVVGKAREVVDLAILGKLLGALGKPLGIGRSPRHLHAGVRRLRGVLPHDDRPIGEKLSRRRLGAGERTAGDDARPDDVLRVGKLDLPCHVGAGGEA